MNSTEALQLFSSNPLVVWVVAGLIGGGALIAYLRWFNPPAFLLEVALKATLKALRSQSSNGWETAKEQVQSTAAMHSTVSRAWRETTERVMGLEQGEGTRHIMLGSPRDIWSAKRLLGRKLNVPLAESVPNLLVGIGLLFTFVFLTIAITEATSALSTPVATVAAQPIGLISSDTIAAGVASSPDITSATRGLLSAAGAKFLTSLAGLLSSIIWTIAARRRMAKLQEVAEEIVDEIEKIVIGGGGELTIFAQLQHSRDQVEATKALGLKQDRKLEAMGEQLLTMNQQQAVMEELLNESREQSGSLKRFETDLAVSLAGAITSAFSPQMEGMTSRLVAAIDGLSDRIGTMNQDALEKMMKDFGFMLKDAAQSEIAGLQQTLTTLAEKLGSAGGVIEKGIGGAADKLDKAGAELLTRVEQVSNSLTTGAVNLDGAIQGVQVAISNLDVTIANTSEIGRRGGTFIEGALVTAGEVVDQLKTASVELKSAGTSVEQISGRLAEAVDSVEEMTREQQSVVMAVKAASPEAMVAIQRVLDVLQQTVLSTSKIMADTKDSMAMTSKTLGLTVAEITTGISEYSKTVADLHRRMDGKLAEAAGTFAKGVTDLGDVVEGLDEMLSSRLPRN